MENPFSRPPGLDEIMEKVTQHPEVRKRIVEAVRRANARFSQVEKVKRIYILNRDLSLEENEITPTLKVKRKEVEKKFLPIFDRIYQDPRFGEEVEPSVRD
jgi:long-chain acyl-CoA synthetase